MYMYLPGSVLWTEVMIRQQEKFKAQKEDLAKMYDQTCFHIIR